MANKIQFEHLQKWKKEQRQMKRYINFKYDNQPTETIDEAKDLTEANYLLKRRGFKKQFPGILSIRKMYHMMAIFMKLI